MSPIIPHLAPLRDCPHCGQLTFSLHFGQTPLSRTISSATPFTRRPHSGQWTFALGFQMTASSVITMKAAILVICCSPFPSVKTIAINAHPKVNSTIAMVFASFQASTLNRFLYPAFSSISLVPNELKVSGTLFMQCCVCQRLSCAASEGVGACCVLRLGIVTSKPPTGSVRRSLPVPLW